MAISDLVKIDDGGFTYPDYPTVLEYFQNEYRRIYGQDVVIGADTQDGEWIAIQAQAVYDTIALAASVYNSFSPLTALGDSLSRNVKINGIRRRSATNSTCDLRIVGQAGTEILNGVAEDILGQKWLLPASVTIPIEGEITVTATAENVGFVSAAANTITKIATPTRGWQSVENVLPATEGVAVESNAELRRRQTFSVALPSQTPLDGTIGAVASVSGVSRYRGYENDTNEIDENGLPPHSIAMVVEGGDATEIATAIANKKTIGTVTHGTTGVTVYDKYGLPNVINFYRPEPIDISVEITITPLTGYLSAYASQIKNAVLEHINSLEIGDDVYLNRIFSPALLVGTTAYDTFDISLIRIKKNTGSFGTSNLIIAFDQAAQVALSDIAVIEI